MDVEKVVAYLVSFVAVYYLLQIVCFFIPFVILGAIGLTVYRYWKKTYEGGEESEQT